VAPGREREVGESVRGGGVIEGGRMVRGAGGGGRGWEGARGG